LLGSSFSSIPLFIINLVGTSGIRLTSKDKSCLAALWRSAKGNESRISTLSNREIASMAGLRSKPQSIKRSLARLEALGLIRRVGNHRGRVIRFLLPIPDGELLPLVIPPEIQHLASLNQTQKMVAAACLAFGSRPLNWLARRCGISVRTFKANIRSIVRKLSELGPFLSPNWARFGSQLGPFWSSLILVESIGSRDRLSSDNLSEVLEAPLREVIVKEREATPANFDYQRYQNNSVRHRPPRKPEVIPEDVMVELVEEVFQHRYITRHRTNRQLSLAARVVKALRGRGGLSGMLDSDQVGMIVRCMSGQGIGPDEIRAVLCKRFGEEERVRLYESLSNDMSPAYGGPGKMVTLSEAAWSNGSPGFSRLVKVWLRPPVLKPLGPPTPRVPADLEMQVSMLIRKAGCQNVSFAIQTVSRLREHYDTLVAPAIERLGIRHGGFPEWFRGFLEFTEGKASSRNEAIHAGWLAVGGIAFSEWEAEFSRQSRLASRSGARATAMASSFSRLEEQERERAFREAHGI
jgi:DNA-binding MarR family transcriptional regulator